jgi:hypothetical protein
VLAWQVQGPEFSSLKRKEKKTRQFNRDTVLRARERLRTKFLRSNF